MAGEMEQFEVFATRRQRSVSIEPLMIHTHDTLVAPVEFTERVPSHLDWGPVSSRSLLHLPCPIEQLLRAAYLIAVS